MAAPHSLTNYTIVAVLHTSNHTVTANTTINYVNHADVPLDRLVFRIYPNAFQPEGSITIESVCYGGANLSYSISGVDSTVLIVDLATAPGPGSLIPAANVTLELKYQVHVPNAVDRFGWYHHTSPEELLVFNLGNWHPIVSVYDERGWHTVPYVETFEGFYSEVATYDVHLKAPEAYVVAATGELQAVATSSGVRTWHWSTGPVRDFTWCASPHYQTSSILANGVNVTSYHVPPHSVGGQRVLQVANQCLGIFGGLFGPYVWESLRIVETSSVGGMEYPQLVMISNGLYENASAPFSLEIVTAHEIGHQWIPFIIGTDSYAEPWIDEGFASYAELAFIEYVYGPAERENHRQNKLESYRFFVSKWGDESINQSMDHWQTSPGYFDVVYNKACLVYDMLRYQLGNATFYQAWRYIYEQTVHQNVRASELQRLFEQATGKSLNWFFSHWVYGTGIVTLSLIDASTYENVNEWIVNFQIQQAQATHVALGVPIQIITADSTELTWVWMDAAPVTNINVSVTSPPLMLILDPEELLLCWYSNRTVSFAKTKIESCGPAGIRKDTFMLNETVYANGTGYSASTTYDVYLVYDVKTWLDGMAIPTRVPNTTTNLTSDISGIIPPTVLWSPPLTLGKYDIIVDINRNGKYDIRIDTLDDNDLCISAGFFIPEFPLLIILPLFIIATLMVAIIYRRNAP